MHCCAREGREGSLLGVGEYCKPQDTVAEGGDDEEYKGTKRFPKYVLTGLIITYLCETKQRSLFSRVAFFQ